MLARVLLDAGASIPLMTESLAASLGLPRRHDPIPITGIAGTARCQFTVMCTVCSVDSRFQLPDVTFTLIPSIEPISKPANTAEILKRPDLRHYSLADNDLGGRDICSHHGNAIPCWRALGIAHPVRALPLPLWTMQQGRL